MCTGKRYCDPGASGEGSSSQTCSILYRSPSPPPRPIIQTLTIVSPLIDISGPHTPSRTDLHRYIRTTPDRDTGKGKGIDTPIPPVSLSNPAKSAFDTIPYWQQQQPPPGLPATLPRPSSTCASDRGFIPYLNRLIAWYNYYHPSGLLGTSSAVICYHIFHRSGLGPRRQAVLQAYWYDQLRDYRCERCSRPWLPCPHSPLPDSGTVFGLSDHPADLLDDMLACFGPERRDENDHDHDHGWGKIPREEFETVEWYAACLERRASSATGSRKLWLKAQEEHMRQSYREVGHGLRLMGREALGEVYRELLQERPGEHTVLTMALEEMQTKDEEQKRRDEFQMRADQVRGRKRTREIMEEQEKEQEKEEGGAKSTSSAVVSDHPGGCISPSKRQKSLASDDEDKVMWDRNSLEDNARLTQELCRLLEEEIRKHQGAEDDK
ncbi:hypothetical protein QBC41DRAFT_371560 [Cercophora samala]|uniref:Uncharacterized protein n=1 Tax=Cercophora samala TaxID=330535 RepID=A0AA39ZIT6_9PEZI|nr:hypothetical protein QBC41DRAFT_371560 [Cercophora samala]